MKKASVSQRRAWRVRKQIKKAADLNGRVRLSVHRTGRHIYAQVIDDVNGVTLAAASSLEADIKKDAKANKDTAKAVGLRIAEKAKEKGIEKVAFDRGSFVFHGRVAAVAEGAREGGLDF